MSFSIHINPIDDFLEISLRDAKQLSNICIISKGAVLNSWTMGKEGQITEFIDGNDFSKGWPAFETLGFKSGKMSPYSCRLHKGQYTHDGKHYTIDKYYLGEHAIHGLLYDANFTLLEKHETETHASVKLSFEYQKEDKGFPFSYQTEVTYSLYKNNCLHVATKITNIDNKSMPLMDGWHPYFSLGDTSIDSCTLQFVNEGQLEYDEALLPTGSLIKNKMFDEGKILANIEIDNGFILQPKTQCLLENKNFQLIVNPIKNYPYLQLYIPPHRKSIAIENLSAAPDCFNNKMGLQILQPQEDILFETSFTITKK